MISRALTRVGTPAAIAAIVTVSAFVSKSRPIIIRRAIVLVDGDRCIPHADIELRLRRSLQLMVSRCVSKLIHDSFVE
ncbi:hypothetical protein, partial [Stenotrophomonas maltophilia]|uniref:hypothetical protein n=1 Tax=Stenotrophomonas maltophilia TaxID=40324 RepID=UPI001954FF7B